MSGARRPALIALLLGLLLILPEPGSAPRAAPRGRAHSAPSQLPDSAVGAAIYLNGVLGSGQALVGARQGGEPLSGAAGSLCQLSSAQRPRQSGGAQRHPAHHR